MFDWNVAMKKKSEGAHALTPEVVPDEPHFPVLDLAPVNRDLAAFRSAVASLQTEAKQLAITDDETNALAVELAAQCRRAWKDIEAVRKGYVDQPNTFIKAVNGVAKALQEPLKATERVFTSKHSQYQARVELERRKAELAAKEEAKRLQEQVTKEAEAAGVEPPVVVPPPPPQAPKVVRTAAGSAHQRTEWTFQVEDEALVPREYLVVSEKLIREAVKKGIRQIPGIRIYEEQKTVLTT